jgi:hypothetical protein
MDDPYGPDVLSAAGVSRQPRAGTSNGIPSVVWGLMFLLVVLAVGWLVAAWAGIGIVVFYAVLIWADDQGIIDWDPVG